METGLIVPFFFLLSCLQEIYSCFRFYSENIMDKRQNMN